MGSVQLNATYSSSSIEEGVVKHISLLDAIKPLLADLPATKQLLLSTHPIKEPWPLTTYEEKDNLSSRNEGKKRKRGDSVERLLQDLDETLRQEIPLALRALQAKQGCHEWLFLGEDRHTTIPPSDSKAHESTSELQCTPLDDSIRDLSYDKTGRILVHERKEGRISWPTLEEAKESKRSESPLMDSDQLQQIIHCLIVNTSQTHSMREVRHDETTSTRFLMPPRSAFLLTNMLRSQVDLPRGWEQLLNFAKSHPPNLLLLDPPYPNYSAKRLKDQKESYKPIDDLYDLWNMVKPIKALLESKAAESGEDRDVGVLVGCWVTNHAKAQRFVLTKLFPAWGVTHIGQLIWIKITCGDASQSTPGGQLVFPLDNKQGRKPYEVLLLGSTKKVFEEQVSIKTRLFASVPLGHSRKPFILPLLQEHYSLSTNVNVYEVFARTLFSGPGHNGYWVNIGNEPFSFNQEGAGFKEQEKQR